MKLSSSQKLRSSQTYTTCTLQGSNIAKDLNPNLKRISTHMQYQYACTHNPPKVPSFKPPIISNKIPTSTVSHIIVQWHNAQVTQVQKTNPNKHSKFHVHKVGSFKKTPRLKAQAPLCIPLATLLKAFHNESTNLHELLRHV